MEANPKRKSDESQSADSKRFKVGDIVTVEEVEGVGFMESGVARVTAVNESDYDVKFILCSRKLRVDSSLLTSATSENGEEITSPTRSSRRKSISSVPTNADPVVGSDKDVNDEMINDNENMDENDSSSNDSNSSSPCIFGCSSCTKTMSWILIGISVILYFYIDSFRGYHPAKHLQGHPLIFQPNLIPPKIGRQLVDVLHKEGETKGFPTNLRDISFYQATHEHIGEAVPLNDKGGCDHPLMTPSKDGTLCVLPGRVDIGKHFISTGGVEGLKESYPTLVSRLLSFGMYVFDLNKVPPVKTLFESSQFIKLAKGICPKDKQVLDPFQFNFIIQMPGQTVASHLDGVYFWGASRFDFPQWLLAAMKFSGLFEDDYIDQVQVVGYLHEWEPKADTFGEFIYWDGSHRLGARESPLPLAGSGVDGTKTVHAASIYRPRDSPPAITKDDDARLVYHPLKSSKKQNTPLSGTWSIDVTGKGTIRNYTDLDLRTSIVYRARCFSSSQEMKKFQQQVDQDNTKGKLSLDNVLKILVSDLVDRGVFKGVQSKEELIQDALVEDPAKRLQLALTILDTYVHYPNPIPPNTFPINYCALPRLVPWTAVFLNPICP